MTTPDLPTRDQLLLWTEEARPDSDVKANRIGVLCRALLEERGWRKAYLEAVAEKEEAIAARGSAAPAVPTLDYKRLYEDTRAAFEGETQTVAALLTEVRGYTANAGAYPKADWQYVNEAKSILAAERAAPSVPAVHPLALRYLKLTAEWLALRTPVDRAVLPWEHEHAVQAKNDAHVVRDAWAAEGAPLYASAPPTPTAEEPALAASDVCTNCGYARRAHTRWSGHSVCAVFVEPAPATTTPEPALRPREEVCRTSTSSAVSPRTSST